MSSSNRRPAPTAAYRAPRNDAERRRQRDFIASELPEPYREAVERGLDGLSRHGIPRSAADLFDGDTRCSAYRKLSEERFSSPMVRACLEAMDERIVRDSAMLQPIAAYVDIVTAPTPAGDVLVLKGATVTSRGLHPDEVTRSVGLNHRPALLTAYLGRGAKYGRRLPLLSNNRDPAFVNAVIPVVIHQRCEWLGQVSAAWAPPRALHAQWAQPSRVDILNVEDALSQASGSGDDGPEFAILHTHVDKHLLVVHGPSRLGRYYVYRPPDTAAKGLKQRILRWVACLEERELSLERFEAERFQGRSDHQNRYWGMWRLFLRSLQIPLTIDGAPPAWAPDDVVPDETEET